MKPSSFDRSPSPSPSDLLPENLLGHLLAPGQQMPELTLVYPLAFCIRHSKCLGGSSLISNISSGSSMESSGVEPSSNSVASSSSANRVFLKNLKHATTEVKHCAGATCSRALLGRASDATAAAAATTAAAL